MGYEDPEYRRGRSGRPLTRLRDKIKREGSHICWLCGKPIDMALHYNDPWSWTMDHLIPLSDAPWLALDEANIREAHRSCNSSRGKRAPIRKVRASRNW